MLSGLLQQADSPAIRKIQRRSRVFIRARLQACSYPAFAGNDCHENGGDQAAAEVVFGTGYGKAVVVFDLGPWAKRSVGVPVTRLGEPVRVTVTKPVLCRAITRRRYGISVSLRGRDRRA